jgi:hypothetical protein
MLVRRVRPRRPRRRGRNERAGGSANRRVRHPHPLFAHGIDKNLLYGTVRLLIVANNHSITQNWIS